MVKYTRSPYDTLIMLAPCHFVTLVLIVALLHPNQQSAAWLFNMAMYLTVYTILALAAPDISNLNTFGRAVFFIQHALLLVVPYYYLFLDRFPLYGYHTWAMYFQATGVIGLWGFIVQHTASMYSGVNVNYFLHPPESPKWFQGRFYLSMLCMLIMSVGYLCGHVLPPVVHRYLVRNRRYAYAVGMCCSHELCLTVIAITMRRNTLHETVQSIQSLWRQRWRALVLQLWLASAIYARV
jgi:hypothetical protein